VARMDHGRVAEFVQSPELPFWGSAGVYCFESTIISRLPERGDLETQLLNELARQGELGGHLVSGDYVRFVDGPKDIEEIGAELTSAGFAWRRPMRPRIA